MSCSSEIVGYAKVDAYTKSNVTFKDFSKEEKPALIEVPAQYFIIVRQGNREVPVKVSKEIYERYQTKKALHFP